MCRGLWEGDARHKGRPCRRVCGLLSAPPGLPDCTPIPPHQASETPHSLVLSVQDIPRHGQQGQQAGLARVLHLPEPLLMLGPRHVVLELLRQEGVREGREDSAPALGSHWGPGGLPPGTNSSGNNNTSITLLLMPRSLEAGPVAHDLSIKLLNPQNHLMGWVLKVSSSDPYGNQGTEGEFAF